MDTLFPPDLPEGFRYEDDFLSADAEAALLAHVRADVTFSAFEMRGVVARRRVAFFGQAYDASRPAAPMPAFLEPLRAHAARWAGLAPETLVMALINEYQPGAPIGWHRDAPQYGIVLGLSLLSPCRMRLRPYVPPRERRAEGPRRRASHEIEVRPRSIYQIAGLARRGYEHGIPPADALRYSITFRTLRQSRAA
jgi:alkylated DNA repair dioxygenase AlkB